MLPIFRCLPPYKTNEVPFSAERMSLNSASNFAAPILCWKMIFHGSVFLTILWSRDIDSFCSWQSFQGCLYREQSWKTQEVVLCSKGQVCLQSTITKIISPSMAKGRFACCHYKKYDFPKLMEPQLWHKPTVCLGVIEPSSYHPAVVGAWGTDARKWQYCGYCYCYE